MLSLLRIGGVRTLSATSATFSVVVLDTIGEVCKYRNVGVKVRVVYTLLSRAGVNNSVR